MDKIVIINKFKLSDKVWKNLEKHHKNPEMTVEQIIDKFNGFEGKLIAIFPFNKGSIKLENPSNQSLILYVRSENGNVNSFIKDQFSFIGYDFGICEEATNYSSIFNEVLFGSIPELTCYTKFLNHNLLFQDIHTVQEYARVHHQLSLQGKDVEWEEYMNVYKIWKYCE